MTCADCRPLLHAHVDGELDLMRDLEVSAHLAACPACRAQFEGIEKLRAAVGGQAPRFAAPDRLRTSLRASIAAESPGRRSMHTAWPRTLGLAAAIAGALVASYILGDYRGRGHLTSVEAIDAHIRSLQSAHPLDVVSTDRHTVKPWFAGKLEFSPPVVDLADTGFPLAGARLDEIAGHTAAALVFHRRLHTVTLFIWPGAAARASVTANGYTADSWTHEGLAFLAVADLPASDLADFTRLYRERSE